MWGKVAWLGASILYGWILACTGGVLAYSGSYEVVITLKIGRLDSEILQGISGFFRYIRCILGWRKKRGEGRSRVNSIGTQA